MSPRSQTIKCQIESCIYCTPDHFCSLKSIQIFPCRPCDCDSVKDKTQSMCANFEPRRRSLFF